MSVTHPWPGSPPVTAEPDPMPPRPSNQRYRSFAERYILERVRNLPPAADPIKQLHELTLEARTAYKMIKEVGTTLEPND